VTDAAPDLDRVWRVGWHADPLAYVPGHLCEWGHRFDDLKQRWRTIYCAILPETALREVLADLRPNAAAIAAFLEQWGAEAADDLPGEPVTAKWRQEQVLAPATMRLDGGVLDLTDEIQRRDIEHVHARLLADHGMSHLDLHEVTTRRRIVTQAIATYAYDELGVAAIRFPSSRDGNPCYALFEGRAELVPAGEPLRLTDPPPHALQNVAAAWQLGLEPAPAPAGEPSGGRAGAAGGS
jgi:hypothetical protein